MTTFPRLPLVATLTCLATLAAAAEGGPNPVTPPPTPTVESGLGDDLSQFNELPVVVSASRGKRQLNQSPVPVSVVSGEDIRLGGYTTVAEALIFTPGVDAAPADRNHWMVGVRGLHEVYSDRTLTMVDGVVADNPLYGGSEFQRLPISLDDLDHIEVVRGPGGAAWGANAFNGVINLISAAPEDTLGTRVGLQVNDFGDLSTNVRWGDFAGPVSWRFTVAYLTQRSSEDVLGQSSPSAQYKAIDRDSAEHVIGNSEVRWHAGSTTDLRVSLGYSYNEEGAFETLGVTSEQLARFHVARTAVTLDQGLSEVSSLHTTVFGNYQDADNPTLLHYRVGEYGLESQVDLALGVHSLSLGGGLRLTHIETVAEGNPEDFTLSDAPITESRVGLFIIDRWQVTAPLTVETQVRGDHYSGTGADWAGRIAGLYAFDDAHDHVLRLAAARAYRTPLVSIREAHTDRFIVFPFGPLVHFDGADVGNEQTWIGEVGWTSHFDPGILLRLDGFYQHYDDLIGYTVDAPSPPLTATPETLGGADMLGAEAEIVYSSPFGRWSGWYGWHDFETEHHPQSVRAFQPTISAVGATTRWNLPLRLIGVANYRFSDVARSKENSLTPYHRLDLALNWRLANNLGEVGIGCHDVLTESYKINPLGSFNKVEIPGRTFFLRGELTF